MARKSNLVSDGKFDASKQLCRKDVAIGSKGLMVTYKWTKTIQFGQRALHIPLAAAPGNVLCPISTYKAMVQMVPAFRERLAFTLPTRLGLQPVSYNTFQTFLRSCISDIGLDPLSFISHSFRRGGTSWAFRVNVPGELIKVQGDWASSAYY